MTLSFPKDASVM